MLSARTIFAEIFDNDEAFRLFCSIAASDEAQGGWENGRIAALGRILRWPRPKAAVLAAGIQAIYLYERLGGWRRMVSLREPARRDALGGKAPAHQPA